ncbi:hypothetical protein [Streptomyces nondiastaticus]|uniref:Uncharacterized protein n=1 Tax=Streptomyces nondiastaticus TaxID=3154512 RepID=A0ABW6U7S8_9ACTN
MTIYVPAPLVQAPQSLTVQINKVPDLLFIYTGVIRFEYARGSSLGHEQVVSYVPDSNGTLQDFGQVDGQAIVTASLSVWDVPDTSALGAVDQATVGILKQPALPNDPHVLVVIADVGAQHARLHGIPYQVTVLVSPRKMGGDLDPESVAAAKELAKGDVGVPPGSTQPKLN